MSAKQIGPVLQAWYKWKSLRLPWRKRFLVGEFCPQRKSRDARAHTLTLFSAGLDLSGNTYWEFRLTRGDPTVSHNLKNNDSSFSASHQQTYPFRRMVHYPRSTHFSEVKVPPAWHQWLRYMRAAPPTLDEQRADVARQDRIKVLAAQADARWAAKPSLLDHPDDAVAKTAAAAAVDAPGRGPHGQPVPPLDTEHTRPHQQRGSDDVIAPRGEGGDRSHVETPADAVGREVGGGGGGKKRRTTTKARREAAHKDVEDPWKAADARRGGPSETWQPQAWNPNNAGSPRRR